MVSSYGVCCSLGFAFSPLHNFIPFLLMGLGKLWLAVVYKNCFLTKALTHNHSWPATRWASKVSQHITIQHWPKVWNRTIVSSDTFIHCWKISDHHLVWASYAEFGLRWSNTIWTTFWCQMYLKLVTVFSPSNLRDVSRWLVSIEIGVSCQFHNFQYVPVFVHTLVLHSMPQRYFQEEEQQGPDFKLCWVSCLKRWQILEGEINF